MRLPLKPQQPRCGIMLTFISYQSMPRLRWIPARAYQLALHLIQFCFDLGWTTFWRQWSDSFVSLALQPLLTVSFTADTLPEPRCRSESSRFVEEGTVFGRIPCNQSTALCADNRRQWIRLVGVSCHLVVSDGNEITSTCADLAQGEGNSKSAPPLRAGRINQ